VRSDQYVKIALTVDGYAGRIVHVICRGTVTDKYGCSEPAG
jgi:hypothetical protein